MTDQTPSSNPSFPGQNLPKTGGSLDDYQPPKNPVKSDAAGGAPSPVTPSAKPGPISPIDDNFLSGASDSVSVKPKPLTPPPTSKPDPTSPPPAEASEALETLNIFELLGVSDGSEQEKESFLDELQQVIWEDFLENDLDLLVTAEEKGQVDEILAQDLPDLEKQEKIITMLEKVIPDLEEIMLEKALELKEDLVRERVASMKDFYQGDQAKLQQVGKAEDLINQGKWLSAAKILNQVHFKD